ncbi:hypothetical protein V1478_004509, partial [Vespula squamosa]
KSFTFDPSTFFHDYRSVIKRTNPVPALEALINVTKELMLEIRKQFREGMSPLRYASRCDREIGKKGEQNNDNQRQEETSQLPDRRISKRMVNEAERYRPGSMGNRRRESLLKTISSFIALTRKVGTIREDKVKGKFSDFR